MRGYSVTYTVGKVHSGENELIYVPRVAASGRRPVILCHGWEATAKVFGVDLTNAPKQSALAASLAQEGFLVAATDLGGTAAADVWGNATHSARINELHTYLANTFGYAADKACVVAVSMGALGGWAYQRDYGKLAAMVGIMPASDLDDIRNNNRLNTQASIDGAWGVGVPPAALPAGANPATYAAAHYAGIPFQAHHSSGDTVVLPGTVTSLVAAIGQSASATVVSNADHGDAVVGGVNVTNVATFLRANGA